MSIAIAPSVHGLPSMVVGVTDYELDIIRGLFNVWQQKYKRNTIRATYFEGKMPLVQTGNIPAEAMHRIKAVLGWPEKAVSVLAERSVFESYVSGSGEADPFGLNPILDANRFDIELPQAIESSYEFSTSFITTALGDVPSGEPEVLVMARSAEWSGGMWDRRRRAISAFLAVTSTNPETGVVLTADVYLPDAVLSLERRNSGSWVATRRQNPLYEVLAEPLPFAPSLSRPFGRSRISRAVMNITDHALINIVRTEISADFYAAPRMYALGVAEDAFTRGKWQAAIDRWFAISRDANGDVPTVGQFPQMTMQPLTELHRLYATMFSGETGVPVSNLGIITDNPPSAESLYADDRRLVSTADRQNRIFDSSLRRVAQRIIKLKTGRSETTDEMRAISTAWKNPAFTSPGTSADALVKLSTVFPWIGETEVALEFAGFSRSDIARLVAEKRRAQSRALLTSLAATPGSNA